MSKPMYPAGSGVAERLDWHFGNIAAGQDYCKDVAEKMNKEFSTDFTRNAIIKRFQAWKKRQVALPAIPVENAEPKPILEPESIIVRDLATENTQLRQVNQRIYRQLQTAKEKVGDLVSATIQGAYDAMLAFGPLQETLFADNAARLLHKEGEAALWVLTDWQGAKKTASYNSEVMRERVQRFCRKAERITKIQRADHPVEECTIAFGGDMVEGLFNFPTQAFEIDATLFGQFVTVSRLLVETVQYALSVYNKVHVVAEWGNHGRIGSHRMAVPRSDNLDRMCYELARQLLSAETRLTWEDSPEDIQRIEIGNYRALLLHSDEIGRNGYASPNTIVSYIVRQKSGAYPWRFRDAYTGHFHTHCEWALPDGEGAVYQTGSTESDNRYAGVMMAASAVPSQRLHFIDKERGRVSAQYKVYVDKD